MCSRTQAFFLADLVHSPTSDAAVEAVIHPVTPQDVVAPEAAEVDGASRWQQFWQITIPMLMPSIIVALIFRTITALQTFDIPYTMTRGGPGEATETLAMLIHKTTIDYLDVGYGSTLAVCMFVLSLFVTAFYLKRIGKNA